MMSTIHSGVAGSGKLRISNIINHTIAISPYMISYNRKQNSLVSAPLTTPATIPSSVARAICVSHNSDYLAVGAGAATSPVLKIYKRDKYLYTALSDPSTIPASCGEIAFSPNDNYMAVAQAGTSPYFIIYSRSGDTFTKLSDPGTIPSANTRVLAWSNDNTYLAVGSDGGTIYVYSVSGSTITLVSTNVVSTKRIISIEFSYDDNYIFYVDYTASSNCKLFASPISSGTLSGTVVDATITITSSTTSTFKIVVSNDDYRIFALVSIGGGSATNLIVFTYNSGTPSLTLNNTYQVVNAAGNNALSNRALAINSSNDKLYVGSGSLSTSTAHKIYSISGVTLTDTNEVINLNSLGTFNKSSICTVDKIN